MAATTDLVDFFKNTAFDFIKSQNVANPTSLDAVIPLKDLGTGLYNAIHNATPAQAAEAVGCLVAGLALTHPLILHRKGVW